VRLKTSLIIHRAKPDSANFRASAKPRRRDCNCGIERKPGRSSYWRGGKSNYGMGRLFNRLESETSRCNKTVRHGVGRELRDGGRTGPYHESNMRPQWFDVTRRACYERAPYAAVAGRACLDFEAPDDLLRSCGRSIPWAICAMRRCCSMRLCASFVLRARMAR